MSYLEEVLAQSYEAARLKEAVLRGQAREVSASAGHLLEALRGGKGVHLLGEGGLAHIARYLAEAYHRPQEGRTLPARLLADPGSGPDGYARAVEAFVRFGEVLLLLSAEQTPRLERAAALARGRKARVVCIAGDAADGLAALCDVALIIPTGDTRVVAEVALSVGHVLLGLVLPALGLEPAPAPRSPSSLSDLGVIDRDPLLPPAAEDDLNVVAELDEGGLLAEAVDLALAPPTDPRGRPPRRAAPPPEAPATPVRFRCGACGDVMTVEPRHLGRRGKCPRCLCELRIPAQAPEGGGPQLLAPEGPRPAGSAEDSRATGRRTRERRRSTRFTVRDAIVRYSREGYPDGRAFLEPHTLEDLSLTGLRFIGRPNDLAVGSALFFAVDFPAFPQPVRFKGEVRRVIPVGEGCSTGVRFLEYVGDAEARIRRLLEQEPLRTVRRR